MTFGRLSIDPAKNPAVLDTGTWNAEKAWALIGGIEDGYWRSLLDSVGGKAGAGGNTAVSGAPARDLPEAAGGFTPYPQSCARYPVADAPWGGSLFLARLADGQKVMVALEEADAPKRRGAGARDAEGRIGTRSVEGGVRLSAFRTDAPTLSRLLQAYYPAKAPRALGAVPRLGIGTRMSTAMWPGIWRSMNRTGYSANAIQNSVRELLVLEELLRGAPPRSNVQFGFGSIQEGHTGSTHEGLWVAGVLAAVEAHFRGAYGADADHIMVKRGPDGIQRAKRIIDASRYYSFYTLDVGDILDYQALGQRSTGGPEAAFRRKYGKALDAAAELSAYIAVKREGEPFDLELSIDETPPQLSPFDHLTEPEELEFILTEADGRGIPLSHVAPNFGVEKGVDYRGADGREGLTRRVAALCRAASNHGVMPDCHSGDDLSRETRRAVGRGSRGRIHFKLSPSLQLLFAEVLHELFSEEFRFWWDDTFSYASTEALKGSELAATCLKAYADSGSPEPSPGHAVFHHFCFATVGKRAQDGRFVFREKFYDLPRAFYEEYTRRLAEHLDQAAEDVLGGG